MSPETLTTWTRAVDRDGDTRFYGLNYRGQVLVDAVEDRLVSGEFIFTEADRPSPVRASELGKIDGPTMTNNNSHLGICRNCGPVLLALAISEFGCIFPIMPAGLSVVTPQAATPNFDGGLVTVHGDHLH